MQASRASQIMPPPDVPPPVKLPRSLTLLSGLVTRLASIAMAISALAMLLSFVLIGWSVVMRYLFNDAPVWVDDLVGIALVAIVMLAAAQSLRHAEHIGVDILVTRLAPRARRLARIWAALATIAISLVLIINGWETAMLARTLGLVTEGALEWPTWMLMLLMPIGGALLLLAAAEVLWRALIGADLVQTGHSTEGLE